MGLESLEGLGGVSSIGKLLVVMGEFDGSMVSIDSLEGVGGVEGLVVPSASSNICRMGDTGREIWNVDGMTLRRFFGPGLRRSGISSLVLAILSHPSQMGLLRSRQLQPL